MNPLRRFVLATFVPPAMIACGAKVPRQEQVTRIMPLGVTFTSTPEGPTLFLLVAAPRGVDIDATIESTSTAQAPAFQLAESLEYRQSFEALDIVHLGAVAATSPPVEGDTAVSSPYVFRVRGGGVEKLVVGNLFSTLGAGDAAVDSDVTVQIMSPGSNDALRPGVETRLSARLYGSHPGPQYMTSWYVSGGEVGDRMESHTTWKPTAPGVYTLIATSRPLVGTGLIHDVRDVVVR